MKITATEALAEIDREIGFRERVYPAWVKAGRMTQARADEQTARLNRVREIVHWAATAGVVRAEFAGTEPPDAVVVEFGGVEYRYERNGNG